MTWMAVTENLGYPPKVHVFIYNWEKDDAQIRGYSIFGQTRSEEDPWFLQGKIKKSAGSVWQYPYLCDLLHNLLQGNLYFTYENHLKRRAAAQLSKALYIG